jgi:tyrosyl-tRNA synthetase
VAAPCRIEGVAEVVADVLDDLQWRGLVQDSTDLAALRAHLAAGPVTFYTAVDPSAPSLQVGNLVQQLTARRLQLAGHQPLLLVGGSTGLIGDPNEVGERSLNAPEVVAGWVDLNTYGIWRRAMLIASSLCACGIVVLAGFSY